MYIIVFSCAAAMCRANDEVLLSRASLARGDTFAVVRLIPLPKLTLVCSIRVGCESVAPWGATAPLQWNDGSWRRCGSDRGTGGGGDSFGPCKEWLGRHMEGIHTSIAVFGEWCDKLEPVLRAKRMDVECPGEWSTNSAGDAEHLGHTTKTIAAPRGSGPLARGPQREPMEYETRGPDTRYGWGTTAWSYSGISQLGDHKIVVLETSAGENEERDRNDADTDHDVTSGEPRNAATPTTSSAHA